MSWKRLAMLICPKAPFLVPGNVLKNSRYVPSFGQIRSISSRERYKRDRSLEAKKARAAQFRFERNGEKLDLLRTALSKRDWPSVASIYPQLQGLLTHDDTSRIVRLLHTYHRINLSKGKDDDTLETTSELLLATDRLVENLRNRTLPPHSSASIHLLSIYKETRQFDKGKELWKWLASQKTEDGEKFVSAGVYGAAIEMLAFAGEPLGELELLYKKALRQFPGTFAEYHFSAEAVLPDRGKALNSTVRGVPMQLLQGIFTARVLYGDWRNAYLAFDTALRLFPDMVPNRFFTLLTQERPLGEGMRVFDLACLAKAQLPAPTLTALLARLVLQQVKTTLEQKANIIAMMIGLFKSHITAGGHISSHYLSLLIKGLNNLVVWTPIGDFVPPELAEYNLSVAECGKRLVAMCFDRITDDVGSTLNATLVLAGKAKDAELCKQVCQMISDLSGWTDVAHRSLVTAAGLIGDMKGLEAAWALLVDSTVQGGRTLDNKDWQALAGAARSINSSRSVMFVAEQLSLYPPPERVREMTEITSQKSPRPSAPQELGCAYSTISGILRAIIDNVEAQLSGDLTTPTPLSMAYSRPSLGSEENLKIIYDELTVDPLQPSSPQSKVDVGSTGIPFDVHRFENWKAVNELLSLANRLEVVRNKAINDAITAEQPLQTDFDNVSLDLVREDQRIAASFSQTGNIKEPLLQEVRQRILHLRGHV